MGDRQNFPSFSKEKERGTLHLNLGLIELLETALAGYPFCTRYRRCKMLPRKSQTKVNEAP